MRAPPLISRHVLAVLCILDLLLLAGCAATSQPAPSGAPGAPAGEPKRGGTLTQEWSASPPGIDSDAHQSTASTTSTGPGNIYLQLLGEDTQARGGKIIGYLAISWDISADAKTWTFKVRELTTAKGKPFNAEDVEYNINRMLTRPNGLPFARSGCIRDMVESVKATDKTTVVFALKEPIPAFFSCISSLYILIMPKYVLEPIDQPGKYHRLTPEEVDGVGPFMLTKWTEGSIWEMTRNPNYYKEGLPYLDKYVIVQLPDMASKIAAFRTKRIDMFTHNGGTPSKIEADELKQEFGDQITQAEGPFPGPAGFLLHWKRKPLDDIRVREAIDLAYNRQSFRDIFNFGEGVPSGPYYCSWGTVFTCDELTKLPGYREDKTQDLQRAKTLMRQAGFNPDQPGALTLTAGCTTPTPDSCDLLKDDLSKIGIDLRISRMEEAARLQQLANQEFDVSSWIRILTPSDPEAYNGQHYLPTAAENRAKWENPKFMELFAKERVELNKEARFKMVREMGQILLDDHVLLHGWAQVLHLGWWSYLKGHVPPHEIYPHQTNYTADYYWLDK